MNTYSPVTPSAAAVGSKIPAVQLADPFADLSRALPGLSGINSQLTNNLSSMLRGQLSPGTINAIQDYAASRGLAGGMPGAGLYRNLGARNIGLSAEQLAQQGMEDYSRLIPTISQTQTNSPALQYQANYQNAVNAAAPDPTAAASYAQQVFANYLKAMESPAAGTGSFGYSMQLPNTFASQRMSGYGGGYGGYGGTESHFSPAYSNLYGNRSTKSPYTVYSNGWNLTDAMSSPSWSPMLGEDLNQPYSYGSYYA